MTVAITRLSIETDQIQAKTVQT